MNTGLRKKSKNLVHIKTDDIYKDIAGLTLEIINQRDHCQIENKKVIGLIRDDWIRAKTYRYLIDDGSEY